MGQMMASSFVDLVPLKCPPINMIRPRLARMKDDFFNIITDNTLHMLRTGGGRD